MQEKAFLTVEEVAAKMSVSKSYANKIVRQLNREMEQLGWITVRGRVNANYFRKRVCYSDNEGE